jgi:hypothetical protein
MIFEILKKNVISLQQLIKKFESNMKKFLMAIVLCLVCTVIFTSCTEQSMVRNFGGTMEVEVPNGYKVTSATWKENDLFYFMEEMEEGYTPKDKMFVESASYGVLESKIIFKEKR